jgi:hypothetical protein
MCFLQLRYDRQFLRAFGFAYAAFGTGVGYFALDPCGTGCGGFVEVFCMIG